MTDDDKRVALHYLSLNLKHARRRADAENARVTDILRRIQEVEGTHPNGSHDCVWAAGCGEPATPEFPFCKKHVEELREAVPKGGV